MAENEMIMEDYSDVAATFGDRLMLARESQNLTREQLARRLGLRTETIQNWEADRSEPRANRLQMLAGFLNVSIVWLLTGEGEGAPMLRTSKNTSADIRALLDEIRDIRLINAKVADRLSKLEKRLREYAEQA